LGSVVDYGPLRQRRTAKQTRSIKAKFHYAIWFEAGRRRASNQLRIR